MSSNDPSRALEQSFAGVDGEVRRILDQIGYLEPLRARAEAAALHDVEDHERLEPLQAAWVGRLARLDVTTPAAEAHAFYLAVSEFHSAYLAHILHEERVTERAMFQHFTHSVGVANIARFAPQLSHLPRYVTQGERGAGFAEVARAILAHR